MHFVTSTLFFALLLQTITPNHGMLNPLGVGRMGLNGLSGIGDVMGGALHGASGRFVPGRHDSSSSEESGESGKHTGRGIDWKSGIGSLDGLLTPIESLLGISQGVCRISYAAEEAIEKLGKMELELNAKVADIDRSVVNYLTDNVVLKAVDLAKKGHIGLVHGVISAQIALERIVFNTAILVFRVVKSPVREMLACKDY